MTYLADNHQHNLKKVLRTALVGIRPADQVLLKGYLRILLRLEADLEWVSANHEQVDLYLISHEFRDAASVLKLLSSQVNKPVLYISRNDNDEAGYMADNHVRLPLKNLDNLRDWLMRYVAVLQKGSGTVTSIMQQQTYKPEDDDNETPVTLKAARDAENTVDARAPQPASAPKSDVKAPTAPPKPQAEETTAQQAPVEASKQFVEPSSIDYRGLVRFIQTLQQRVTGLQQITAEHNNARRRVAIIEPSTGRLWQDTTMPVPLNLSWIVEDYNDERPSDSDASDLVQWLWQAAWRQSALLAPLINDDASYRLRYWVKPALDQQGRAMNAKERREMMRVMTAIESAPRNVSQLANRADISVSSSKKIIASLLFAGSLQADSYSNINTRIQRAEPAATPKADSTAPTPARPAAPAQLTMEELLARRARGEHTSTATGSSVDIDLGASKQTQAPSETERPAQPAKSGFLSKLRQKLGL